MLPPALFGAIGAKAAFSGGGATPVTTYYNFTLATAADDGREFIGAWASAAGAKIFSSDNNAALDQLWSDNGQAGFSFPSVTASGVIGSAILTVYVISGGGSPFVDTTTGTFTVELQAIGSGGNAVWSGTNLPHNATYCSNKSTTNACTPAGVRNIDVTAMVNEAFADPDWASGQRLNFRITYNTDIDAGSAVFFDGVGGTNPANLTITS